jgi:hypothetical protein
MGLRFLAEQCISDVIVQNLGDAKREAYNALPKQSPAGMLSYMLVDPEKSGIPHSGNSVTPSDSPMMPPSEGSGRSAGQARSRTPGRVGMVTEAFEKP